MRTGIYMVVASAAGGPGSGSAPGGERAGQSPLARLLGERAGQSPLARLLGERAGQNLFADHPASSAASRTVWKWMSTVSSTLRA